MRWSTDGTLYLHAYGRLPAAIYRVDPTTGSRTLWKELMPVDPSGVIAIHRVVISADATAYAYTHLRFTDSTLYLAEGLV